MTVATDAPSEELFVGAGVAAPLQIQWRFIDGDDLVVTAIVDGVEDPAPLVRGIDYAVAGGGSAGGTVTPLAAIAVGTSWRVRRETPKGQPASLPTGSYNPKQIEQALDRQGLVLQEHDRDLARAPKVPRGESAMELPGTLARADRLLAFGPTGEVSQEFTAAKVRSAILNSSAALTQSYVGDGVLWSQPATGAQIGSVEAKLRETVSVMDFGAIGDGFYHPLSERYATLAEAQADYPFATDLADSRDWAALQAGLDYLEATGGTLLVPAGRFIPTRSIRLPSQVIVRGEGKNVSIIDNQNLILAEPQFVNKAPDVLRNAGFRDISLHGGTHALRISVAGVTNSVEKLILDGVSCFLQTEANLEFNRLEDSALYDCDLDGGNYGLRVTGFPCNANELFTSRLTNHVIADLSIETLGEGFNIVGGSFEDNDLTGSQTGQCVNLPFGFRGFNCNGAYFESTHPTIIRTLDADDEPTGVEGVDFVNCIISGHKLNDGSGLEAFPLPFDTGTDPIGFDESNYVRHDDTLPPQRIRGGHPRLTDTVRIDRGLTEWSWRVARFPDAAADYAANAGAFDVLQFGRNDTANAIDNLQTILGDLYVSLRVRDSDGLLRSINRHYLVAAVANENAAIVVTATQITTSDSGMGGVPVTVTMQQKAGATASTATLEAVLAGVNSGFGGFVQAAFVARNHVSARDNSNMTVTPA